MSAIDQAWQLEEQFWAAGVSGEVPGHYAQVLTSDAFVVVPGAVLGREALIRRWDGRTPWKEYELTEQRNVLVNGETVVLSYRVVATGSDGSAYRGRVSSVYTWITGWALAFRQHTPDPAVVDDIPPG